MSDEKILHPDFAERFQLACEGNPHVPPQHYGRLGWIVKQLQERFQIKTTPETVRRWSAGEARPRADKMKALAQLLQVDQAWLALGEQSSDTPRERKLRDAEQDGAVNVLAGVIRMCGGNPAFPTLDDEQATANLTDLYAIIKGAQYAMHVVTPVVRKGFIEITVSAKARKSVVIVVVMKPGLNFEFYELPFDVIEESGELKSGSYTLKADTEADIEGIRRIETFAERL